MVDSSPELSRFWRLFADYERLTVNEGAALSAQEYDTARSIQGSKPVVLAALSALAAQLNLRATESPLRERVEKLAALERGHHALVGRQRNKALLERQNLEKASARVRALGQSYHGEEAASGRPAFFAHG